MRGIWSRPTPKGEVEGDLAGGGACSRGVGVPAKGGVPALGVAAPGGACSGGCGTPPLWLLLRAVCILLECILVLACVRQRKEEILIEIRISFSHAGFCISISWRGLKKENKSNSGGGLICERLSEYFYKWQI